MPLIGSLNLCLQVGQSPLDPLNVFFVRVTPHFPATICMPQGVQGSPTLSAGKDGTSMRARAERGFGNPPVFLLRNNPPADSGLYPIQNPGGLHPLLTEGGPPMMKPNSGVAATAIDRILELSVDAHIRRRGTVRDSAKFHNLTGAIVAYGKVLAVLTALQQREEFHAISGQHDGPGCVAGAS